MHELQSKANCTKEGVVEVSSLRSQNRCRASYSCERVTSLPQKPTSRPLHSLLPMSFVWPSLKISGEKAWYILQFWDCARWSHPRWLFWAVGEWNIWSVSRSLAVIAVQWFDWFYSEISIVLDENDLLFFNYEFASLFVYVEKVKSCRIMESLLLFTYASWQSTLSYLKWCSTVCLHIWTGVDTVGHILHAFTLFWLLGLWRDLERLSKLPFKIDCLSTCDCVVWEPPNAPTRGSCCAPHRLEAWFCKTRCHYNQIRAAYL